LCQIDRVGSDGISRGTLAIYQRVSCCCLLPVIFLLLCRAIIAATALLLPPTTISACRPLPLWKHFLCSVVVVVIVVIAVITVPTTAPPPLSCNLFDCCVLFCCCIVSTPGQVSWALDDPPHPGGLYPLKPLAGNVANMSATCWADSQMPALSANTALSCRHKTDPDTAFSFRGWQHLPLSSFSTRGTYAQPAKNLYIRSSTCLSYKRCSK
jgi:hypothetical protein